MTAGICFPAGMDARGFLDSHWQRRPLLMRQALPGVRNPLSPEELAGLACEAPVEARLVLEHGSTPWQVRHGPFDDNDFTSLPDSHWTLLVQDVDKHLAAAADLLEPFTFLPRWRIDDLMVSYAADQGSVGPHLDAYDVFLIQTLGRRRWRISASAYEDPDLIPDLDIKVLARFQTEQEWVLEPGDVLYLPPGIAHWGIAEGPCMTCSVGFRSPSQQELAAGWLQELLDRSSERLRYRDPTPLSTGLGGEIPSASVNQVRALLTELCQWDEVALSSWFGRFITEPKPQLEPDPADPQLQEDELSGRLDEGELLVSHPHARLAFSADAACPQLFADGQSFALTELPAWVAQLCDRRPIGRADIEPEHFALLLELYNQGSLLWADEVDEFRY
jgi:50S ribosomal protein L16 3-hydroxylase